MKAYSFDKNGIYCNDVDCQKNPLEGGFLLPGNSTFIKPPKLSEKETCVFNKNKWKVIPDYRGEVFYKKETKEKIIINSVNIIPDDTVTNIKPKDKNEKWDNDSNSWVIDLNLVENENAVKKIDGFFRALENNRLIDIYNQIKDTETLSPKEISVIDEKILHLSTIV